MEEVILKGKEAHLAGSTSINEPSPDDCYMFSYTSGTTGDPKGVKLSHKMIIGTAYAVQTRMSACAGGPYTAEDSYMSYLPAAHSFE